MSENKLVTQIICYYNEKRYLGRAIESILNQSYTNWELILIDDGSTDESADIAASFQDDRIVHVYNKENHGLAWCRNQGLALAKGEYIGFADADDIVCKDKLKKMSEYLDKHEDILVVSGGYIFIDKYGNKQRTKIKIIPEDIDIRAHMLFGNCVSGACAIFRRTVVDEYHILHDITMRTSQDYFFWHECLRYGKFHNIDEPMFLYTVGHNSQCDRSRQRDPKQYDDILLRIFHHAWKIRGFHLNKDDINYIFMYMYNNERIKTINGYIKGYKLYRKIKLQADELNLTEGSKILSLYREHMKKHIVNDIKHVVNVIKHVAGL